MEEARNSDIANTQMNLVDLSTFDQSKDQLQNISVNPDDDSAHHEVKQQQGFCVKEYEEEKESLKKENFNLKLRIYYLEEKNPNIPKGAEELYKQNIELKIENESLLKDLQDKQELLCQASQALELLDGQKNQDLNRSQMTIEELNQKIESLQHEVNSLQTALTDANKSTLGNDTGYADFLGAVDSKDIDYQRKIAELSELEANFMRQMNEMNEKVKDLQEQKKDIEIKASNLLYENDEMKDKLASVETKMKEQTHKLEAELKEYKEKWAATQCDLQDTEEKLKETETEREKTLAFLKKTLVVLEQERVKINDLENQLSENRSDVVNKDCKKNRAEGSSDYKEELSIKNQEILKLKQELSDTKRQIQIITSQDINEKNKEIEKLSNLLSNINKNARSPALASSYRFSLEQLSESFNELKFQQAMEEKKNSQQKVEMLMNELTGIATDKMKDNISNLQHQMSIVVEKQNVTDDALQKCAELCAYSLDHLHELAQFLSALMEQKEIRESLSEMTMFNIQSTLDKTFEVTNQAERFSMANRMSSLPDISSLEMLMNTARNSLASIKEIRNVNKPNESQDGIIQEMENLRTEFIEINKANQLLEDEICQLKESLEDYKLQLTQSLEEVSSLKKDKDELNKKIQEKKNEAEKLYNQCEETETKLTAETVKKIEFEMRASKSEALAAELKEKFERIQSDLESNWITKAQHETIVKRLEDDIIKGEAQVATVRMEIDSLRLGMFELKTEFKPGESSSVENASDKENLNPPSSRRTLEISDDRKCLLTSVSETTVSSSTDRPCVMCPKYREKIAELKKYLARAMDQIKFNAEVKARNDRHIQKQLSNTESFLHSARSNMENILKSRNQE